MHGGQAFLLVFAVLLLLNVPTFLFGFLAAKCSLYVFPGLKRFFIVRWVFPLAVAMLLLGFGVGMGFAHLEKPWPTSPALSGWGCVGLLCVLDLGLLLLWSRLKYGEYARRETVAAAPLVEGSPLPTPAECTAVPQNGIPRAWQSYFDAPRAVSRRAAFYEGFAAPWRGLAYLRENPSLWSYAIIPILLNLLITAVAFVVFLVAAGVSIVRLHPLFPEGWGWVLLEVLAVAAVLALALLVTLAVWTLLQGVLCGYFYGRLARKVELRLGMPPEGLKELPLSREVVDSVVDSASLVLVNVGLLLLHVIPVLGSLGSLAGSLYFDCYLLGREYLDFPLGLRGLSRAERRAFARRFRAQTLGLGAVALLMTFVPILGAVALTTAVVGAVLLHRRLAAPTAPPEAFVVGQKAGN